MQFIVTGYDGTDEGALERRLAVREEHLKLAKSMADEGKLLYAMAIVDENEKMIGSVMVMEVPTRENLDEYLKTEPYIIGNVWQKIDIKSCKVAPIFAGLHR